MNIIKLSNNLTNQINTRASVANLFSHVKKVDLISIDFEGIEFISRAAAHELCSKISELSKEGTSVNFINLNNDIDSMLNRVSMKSTDKKATFVQRKSFRSDSEFKAYLLNI